MTLEMMRLLRTEVPESENKLLGFRGASDAGIDLVFEKDVGLDSDHPHFVAKIWRVPWETLGRYILRHAAPVAVPEPSKPAQKYWLGKPDLSSRPIAFRVGFGCTEDTPPKELAEGHDHRLASTRVIDVTKWEWILVEEVRR